MAPEPASGKGSPCSRGWSGTEFCVDIVVKGRKTEVPERFRKHVAEKAGQDPEARRQGDQPRRRGVQGAQPPAGRPQRPGGDHAEHPRPGGPRGSRRRGPVRRAGRGRGQAGGAAAQGREQAPHPPGQRPDSRPPRSPRRAGRRADQRGRDAGRRPRPRTAVPTTRIGSMEVRGEGPLVVREKTHAGRADGARPGALRDGAGRARLLPVRRQRDQAAERGLPPARLRLRRDPSELRPDGASSRRPERATRCTTAPDRCRPAARDAGRRP